MYLENAMKVDFPIEQLPNDILQHQYQFMIDIHSHHEKIYSRQEFSYIKTTGVFLLMMIVLIILSKQEMIDNYFLAATISGLSFLIYMLVNMLLISPSLNRQRKFCIEQGKELEKTYSIMGNYFQNLDALDGLYTKSSLLTRVFPLFVVGGFTTFSFWSFLKLILATST